MQQNENSNEILISRIRELEKLESEHKNSLKELAHERELLHALMDNIPDTIYFKDTESRFTRINKAQAKMLGVDSSEEAIGKTDFDFFNAEHAENAFADESELLRSGKPVISKKEKIRRSDGEYRWVTATKVPIKNKKGKYIGLVGISRDITDQILAEEKIKEYTEQLKDLNSTKDRLFSVIAHDLKSPFTSLLGSASFLAQENSKLGGEEINILAGSIYKSATNIYNFLENLLQWARTQLNIVQFNPQKLYLHDITKQIIDLYSENISKKCIKIVDETDSGHFAFADYQMTSMVLRNIISNAIKFTNLNGKIVLQSSADEKFLKVCVTDNGVGIPQDIINKLFKVDEYISTLGTNKEKGTGLGLILCKEFVEKNGGQIFVESEQGAGTTFSFTLPLYAQV